MVEKTIELTDAQMEKVKILEESGISIGDAIDMLFKFKEDVLVQSNDYIDQKISIANEEKAALQEEIDQIDKEIAVFSKLKDTSLDINQKREILEKEYCETKTYDDEVQAVKRNISWAHDFFKF